MTETPSDTVAGQDDRARQLADRATAALESDGWQVQEMTDDLHRERHVHYVMVIDGSIAPYHLVVVPDDRLDEVVGLLRHPAEDRWT